MDSSYGTTSPGRNGHKYITLPSGENETGTHSAIYLQSQNRKRRYLTIIMGILGVFLFLYLATVGGHTHATHFWLSCDTVETGYTCQPKISRFWGQYSPYFSVPSEISPAVPAQCKITFAQILSRHGARDPTTAKTVAYAALVDRIHAKSISYAADYAFIENYEYTLGANDLSVFGQQQMVNSGIKFYNRYRSLARNTTPFIRSSGSDRVIESAQNWTQGFHSARIQDWFANKTDGYPYDMVIISEETGSNNTLDHGLCTAFENGYESTIGSSAQAAWASLFTPNITARLNANLPGLNFTVTETIYFMDLCPFTTVANIYGKISPFCDLFTESEWRAYDYYQTLGKYYSYGPGNPLGPTQGVGFTNELIARLTASTVQDHTSTNSTLDDSIATFPVGGTTRLYADFSHDNDMTGIFSALGLYNSTTPLSNTTLETVQETHGYSASWTATFAGRAYFEKMSCKGQDEELVRVLVNDRVVPPSSCGADSLGRCTLSRFIESLSFARSGGLWDECFK